MLSVPLPKQGSGRQDWICFVELYAHYIRHTEQLLICFSDVWLKNHCLRSTFLVGCECLRAVAGWDLTHAVFLWCVLRTYILQHYDHIEINEQLKRKTCLRLGYFVNGV